jgi:hypothetical protein
VSHPNEPREFAQDWTILKYGWVGVFLVHVVFLGVGLYFLKQAYYMEDVSLYTPAELRISYFLTSVYMATIAFSVVLLIVAVFVLEIFRSLRKLSAEVAELGEKLEGGSVDKTIPVDPPGPG